MKNIFLVFFIILAISCQREARNELGVGYNKVLIIPPTNDLPLPNPSNNKDLELVESDNSIIKGILNKTEAINADPNIIDQIDNQSGYETDETIFQRLFKVKKE
tara:strand:+ start:396 stop:707 length:312 start_codon:yes stop_codon:yes gene_type:complete